MVNDYLACVASVSVRFRSKERGTRVKDRAKNGVSKRAGRGYFHFLALVSFLARPKPRIPFLGLSLLRNQTETLATQATGALVLRIFCCLRARARSPHDIWRKGETACSLWKHGGKKSEYNVISNNNKTEKCHITTFTFTFNDAINFLCFLNIRAQKKLRIKLCWNHFYLMNCIVSRTTA